MPRPKKQPVLDLRTTPESISKPVCRNTSVPLSELEPFEPEVMDLQPEYTDEPEPTVWHRAPLPLRLLGGLITLAVLLAGSFELVYAHKIMPGVVADGIDLSGLTQADARTRLAERIATFNNQ